MSESRNQRSRAPWYGYICGCCCVIEYTEADGLSLHKPPHWIRHGPPEEVSNLPPLRMTLDEEDQKYPAFVRESTKSIDLNDPITLEDLQKIIPTIDQDLEGNIKSWEESFRKYEELENKSLEVIGPELVKVLGKLRDDPDAFINSSNPSIRSLARTRTSLYATTSQRDSRSSRNSLEIEGGNNSSSGSERRRSFVTPQPHHEDSPVRSLRRGSMPETIRPMSMNSVISHSYTERLSEFNGHMSPNVVSNSREGTDLVFGRRVQSVAMSRTSSGPLSQKNPIHQTMGTRELSMIWAGRLAELSPSQGQLSKQVGLNGQVLSLKMTPKWPGWLSDCLYDVIKINKYGKRQRRIIKLTEYHLLNVKDGKSVTKVVPYAGIQRIILTSPRSFSIDYEIKCNSQEVERGTLYYESLLSAHIVQQVTTRTQIRRDLDRIGRMISRDDVNRLGYSVGVTEAMIHTITELVTKNNSDITQFALLLGRRTFEQILSINPELIEPLPSSLPAPSSPVGSLSMTKTSSLSRQHTIDVSASVRRLLAIQQGSGEYKLKNLIQKIILDVQSPEGNTLRHFLQNFPNIPKDKNITELRHFIDGLYEYLIENHVTLFATCLQSHDSHDDDFPTAAGDSIALARSTSHSSQAPAAVPLKKEPSSPQPLLTNSPIPSLQLTEELLISISYIAYTVVEETLFLALQPKIISYCLAYEVRENAEELLLRKMKVLSTRSQQEFEIPEDHRSPTDWSTALFELAGVERNPTPSMRIHALVRTARAIYTEYKTQIAPRKEAERRLSHQTNTPSPADTTSLLLSSSPHSPHSPPHSATSVSSVSASVSASLSASVSSHESNEAASVLGADDFLPIFIFVFCRSELEHPIQNKDLLWKLCHPDQLQGESGYYLTIYESAVEYVLAYEIPDEILDKVDLSNRAQHRRLLTGETYSSSPMSSISKFFSFRQQR